MDMFPTTVGMDKFPTTCFSNPIATTHVESVALLQKQFAFGVFAFHALKGERL